MKKKRFSVIATDGTNKKTLAMYDEIEPAIKLADKRAKNEIDKVFYKVYDNYLKEAVYIAH